MLVPLTVPASAGEIETIGSPLCEASGVPVTVIVPLQSILLAGLRLKVPVVHVPFVTVYVIVFQTAYKVLPVVSVTL